MSIISNLKDKCGGILEKINIPHKDNFCEVVNESENEMPIPTDYRISTMTMITDLNRNINLQVVSKYFILDKKITKMEYGEKPMKNNKQTKKVNRPFFNQATFIVELNPIKIINIKVFSNGKVQMTGIKRKEDGKKALKLIIDKLIVTSGIVNIYMLLDEQLINYYLTLFNKNNLEKSYYIKNKQNKYILDKDKLYEEIVKKTNKNINDIELFTETIEKKDDIQIAPIQIVLINSDYQINFFIKRNNLYNVLSNNYSLTVRFEPSIYPGVNCKYYWNKKYKDRKYEGKCYCSKKCIGKGNGEGEGQCKKITIACFQSGSVIITGARSIEHILAARNFINRVFRENYEIIRKIEAHFIDKSNKVETKKYIKTSDIVYIKKKDIDNEHNKHIIEKYMNIVNGS
mgnify:CR=1 FL=1